MELWQHEKQTFGEQIAERLFTLEPKLRRRVQEIERDPARRYREDVSLSLFEARTILRALLPACMAIGRKRRATLALQGALAGFTVALAGTTEPASEDQALSAGLALHAELGTWLDELRWHQATRKARRAWAREQPVTAIARQSTADSAEQPENKRLIPPRERRKNGAAQRALLLPIAGSAATPIAAELPAKAPSKKAAA